MSRSCATAFPPNSHRCDEGAMIGAIPYRDVMDLQQGLERS